MKAEKAVAQPASVRFYFLHIFFNFWRKILIGLLLWELVIN